MSERFVGRFGNVGAGFFLLFTVGLGAASVTPEMAATAAQTHVSSMRETWTQIPQLTGHEVTISGVRPLDDPRSNQLLGYVVDLTPCGFVVFSADTEIDALICYSFRTDFHWEDDPQNILLHMVRSDLELRQRALSELGGGTFTSSNSSWQNYLEGNLTQMGTEQWPEPGSTTTGGWVETTWNQGNPYNMYCPTDPGTGNRCVVGCVATAMSQIVDYNSERRDYMGKVEFEGWDRYTSQITNPDIHIDSDSSQYNFPSFGRLNEYLGDVRDKYVSDEALSSSNLAALNFASGVSVKMSYSSWGSGASISRVATALKSKFEYPSAQHMTSAWLGFYDTLSANMKDSLPAELAIYQTGYVNGHAIVCDGLRETAGQDDQYHLNFGWGPSSPDPIGSAWYVLPQGMPAGYSIVNGAVMNIYPPEASYQPDNLISTVSADEGYTGDDVYEEGGPGQTINLNQDFSSTSVYYIKVQNDGNLDHKIRVVAEENGESNWQARYYNHETNKDLTSAITGSGWLTAEMEPGEEKIIRLEVTVPADAPAGEAYTVNITSSSHTDPEFYDAVSIVTFAAVAEGLLAAPRDFSISIPAVLTLYGELTVFYAIPYATHADIQVYDAGGRRVRTLVKKDSPAGFHTVYWNAVDSRGFRVPAGTYFVVLSTPGGSWTTKAVIVR